MRSSCGWRVYEWLVRIRLDHSPGAAGGVRRGGAGGRQSAGRACSRCSGSFLVAMLAGLTIHSFIYYPLVAWFVGKKIAEGVCGEGADAIMTAMSRNSSLATVPVTPSACTG